MLSLFECMILYISLEIFQEKQLIYNFIFIYLAAEKSLV